MDHVQSRRRPLHTEVRAQETAWPRRHRPDYGLLLLMIILLAIGLVVIYSISPGLSQSGHVSQNYYISKQLIAVALGVVAFIVVSAMPIGVWKRLQTPLIVAAAASAIAVRLVGQQVNGAYRWIQIGGISFQSAELIKMALLISLAGFLSDRIRTGDLGNTRKTLYPVLACLAILVVVVAGLQSDLGSTGVMIVMMAAMVFVAGMPLKKVVMIGAVVMVILILAVSVLPYGHNRIATYLHPTAHCLTTSYQTCQALISVGSGGMIGLGLGRSVQAYGYLPEPANDSIFAIYSEKFGFVGDAILLGLFMFLFARIKRIIERAPDDYTRLIGVGILAWLSAQALINIGTMIGVLPLTGITLPFISYGGTSVLFAMAACGLLFQISRFTTYQAPLSNGQGEGTNYDNRLNGRRVRRSYNATASSRSRA